MKKNWELLFGIAGVCFFIVIWHLASSNSNAVLASPLAVYKALIHSFGHSEIWQGSLGSISRVFIGWSLAFFLSAVLATGIYLIPQLHNFLLFPLRIAASIPPIAWTPISLIWFGIGNPSAYFIVFLGCFFPIFIAILAALDNIDKHYLETAAIFGATRRLQIPRVIIPSILPRVFVGAKTALAVGWFNVIAAELVGVASGLGYQLQINRVLLSIDNVILIMLIIGAIGWLMSLLINTLETVLVPWSENRGSVAEKIDHLIKPLLRHSNITRGTTSDMPAPWTAPTDVTECIELLTLKNVCISYPSPAGDEPRTIVNDVSFTLKKGKILAIVGPNGCGKSTLLRAIAGLNLRYTGEARFCGKSITGTEPDRNLLFQNRALFPWMTVRQNLNFALLASGRKAVKPPDTILQQLGLGDFSDFYPRKLSGGMQQKLAVARSLIISPKLLMLDEPFSAYDATSRLTARQAVRQMITDAGTTVIIVTHDIDEAIFMADEILLMDSRGNSNHEIISVDLPPKRDLTIIENPKFNTLRVKLMEALLEKANSGTL